MAELQGFMLPSVWTLKQIQTYLLGSIYQGTSSAHPEGWMALEASILTVSLFDSSVRKTSQFNLDFHILLKRISMHLEESFPLETCLSVLPNI